MSGEAKKPAARTRRPAAQPEQPSTDETDETTPGTQPEPQRLIIEVVQPTPAAPPEAPAAEGDGEGVEFHAADDDEWGRKRKEAIDQCDLNPASLIGSYFHALENGDIIWQGCVVAEPDKGVYLCHFDKLEPGAEKVQRLVPIKRMMTEDDGYDWRFYDTEEAANKAYVDWVTSERHRL